MRRQGGCQARSGGATSRRLRCATRSLMSSCRNAEREGGGERQRDRDRDREKKKREHTHSAYFSEEAREVPPSKVRRPFLLIDIASMMFLLCFDNTRERYERQLNIFALKCSRSRGFPLFSRTAHYALRAMRHMMRHAPCAIMPPSSRDALLKLGDGSGCEFIIYIRRH